MITKHIFLDLFVSFHILARGTSFIKPKSFASRNFKT